MRRNAASFLLSVMTVLLVLGSSGCAATATMGTGDVPRIGADELKLRLSDPSLVVIDVRTAGDWKASSLKVKGAIREEGEGVANWASNHAREKTIVLYCA